MTIFNMFFILFIIWGCVTLTLPIIATLVLLWAYYSPFRKERPYPNSKLEETGVGILVFWVYFSLLPVAVITFAKLEDLFKKD